MASRAASFDLALPPRDAVTPAYRWLYASLRSAILGGQLRPGARLPATRDLAGQYRLARGTVINAFELLKAEGYIEGSVGSGTRVSSVLPDDLLHVAPEPAARPSTAGARRVAVSRYARQLKLFPGYEDRPIRAFRANLPALELFPADLWAQLTARSWRRISRRLLMGCHPLGYLPLRQAVAQYLNASRGVACGPEQVVILSGVQEALDLAARLLLNPGDRVAMEDPGYPGAALAFGAHGAKLVFEKADEEGMLIPSPASRHISLVYLTPGHQFPRGTIMSLARRLQLLDWARTSGALIFEDDYDSEYRYSGRPIPALQGLGGTGAVLYAGSFSKVLFPALRLGYLVAPLNLLDLFEAAISLTSRHTPLLEQLVLTEFIKEGHFARHLRRMRKVYAERLSVFMEQARLRLSGLLEISSVAAGLQTTGWLSPGLDAERVAVAALKRNVDVTPLSRYSLHTPGPQGLQLGFAALDRNEIRRGIRELAIVLETESHASRHE